jgi:hypothetical protein
MTKDELIRLFGKALIVLIILWVAFGILGKLLDK